MSEKEKKRKRLSDAGGPKKKKVALEGQTGTAKVSHIPSDETWLPVVASTPGLSVPNSVKFKTYKKRDLKVKHKETNSKGKSDELLLHSKDHPAMDYTGREHVIGSDAHLTKHYVAVYDPKTGELQIVEALKMDLRSSLRSEDEALREKERAKEENGLSLRQELGMAFGTKKAKKNIASLAENAIGPRKARDISPGSVTRAVKANPSAMAVLESMAVSADNAPSMADLQAHIDSAKPRPRFNVNAQKPEEVYEVKTIIGDEVMKELKVRPWVDAVEANEEVQTNSRYVSHRLRALCQDDEIIRLKALKYMLLLLDFFMALRPKKDGGKKLPEREELQKKMGADKFLIDTVRRRFADGNEMSKWHVDNLMTHLAALSLIVDESQTDTYDLREDLGLQPKEISAYFSEIGSHIANPTAAELARMKLTKAEGIMHRIAKLKLPLVFPKQRKIPLAGSRR